jgi:hypothetical protein
MSGAGDAIDDRSALLVDLDASHQSADYLTASEEIRCIQALCDLGGELTDTARDLLQLNRLRQRSIHLRRIALSLRQACSNPLAATA